jgi:hypothetical protein
MCPAALNNGSFGVSTRPPARRTLGSCGASPASHGAVMATDSGRLDLAIHHDALQAHSNFLASVRSLYSASVVWSAPTRKVRCVGREEVIRLVLREASGMHDAEFTLLRRNATERQIIDEFAVRFVYTGAGIDNAPIAAGDFVELKRVRILDLLAGKVTAETCIENWTVLHPHAAAHEQSQEPPSA